MDVEFGLSFYRKKMQAEGDNSALRITESDTEKLTAEGRNQIMNSLIICALQ
jgi:hypothetical protein